jgi:polyribonucleotide nucleotidyltransferase
MTNNALEQALEAIYESLHNNNEGLDKHILALKIALHAEKAKSVEIDPKRIPEPNRQGRKTMQSYFKKRGVSITFSGTTSVTAPPHSS